MGNISSRLIIAVLLMTAFTSKSDAQMELSINDRARLGEVYSLERLRQFSQAMPTIELLHERYANNPEVLWTYVRVVGFGGHWKAATAAFDQLCAVKCDNDKYVTYAHILESQGPNPETLSYIKRLADQHPDLTKIKSIYKEILAWDIQDPKGRQAVKDLSDQNPNDVGLMEAAGDLAYRAKNYELAKQEYEKVLQQHSSPDLLKKYAYALIGQKQYAQAIAQMDRLIADNPGDKDLRYEHAQVLAAAGQHRQAVQELRALITNGYKNKEALIMLGDELRLLGSNEEALKVYEEVVNEK